LTQAPTIVSTPITAAGRAPKKTAAVTIARKLAETKTRYAGTSMRSRSLAVASTRRVKNGIVVHSASGADQIAIARMATHAAPSRA
jgi:hypothetical protein